MLIKICFVFKHYIGKFADTGGEGGGGPELKKTLWIHIPENIAYFLWDDQDKEQL